MIVRCVAAFLAVSVSTTVAQGQGDDLPRTSRPSPIASPVASPHPAAESRDLEAFRPEFLPRRLQAKIYLRNKEIAQAKVAARPGVNPHRFFIQTSRRWLVGSTVTFSFKGGNNSLREKVATAASEWTKHANLKFDFGKNSAGEYRSWRDDDVEFTSHIRISFDHPEGGYWSLVGTDSANPGIVRPFDASLNLQNFHIQLPDDYAAIVMHEVGHAIGFLHEHQSPLSGCDAEFKWEDDSQGPGIYTLMARQDPPWTKGDVDFNMRQMPTSNAFEVGPYDPLSIMHYTFPAAFFVHGSSSACFVPRNLVLSEGDKAGARKAYPLDPLAQQAVRNERASQAEVFLRSEQLPNSIKTELKKSNN